jgi:4-aminobutyrate aminotransferase-like enzyme
MKIRTGFVSNSSSSSFVIGKYFMTLEQIEEMQGLANKLNMSRTGDYPDDSPEMAYKGVIIDYDDNTYVDETQNYFYGEIGHYHEDVILRFMEVHNFDEDKYVLAE